MDKEVENDILKKQFACQGIIIEEYKERKKILEDDSVK